MTQNKKQKYAIEADNLTKKYGNLTAVDNISFKVRKNEIFGFLGPNGAGKTTTINMLIGLSNITSGSRRVNNQTVKEKIQQSIGVVPSESNLYPELTGFENLSFAASLYGMDKKLREKRAAELLQKFDLAAAAERKFGAYSKGMKRKLTLAAGIIHQPEILFLDEPTTGVDVKSARQIRRLIAELNQEGSTIFLTTHYIEEAERLCDRVAFLVNGRIKHLDTTANLLNDAQEGEILEFLTAADVPQRKDEIKKELAGYEVEFSANKIKIYLEKEIAIKQFVDLFSDLGIEIYEAKLLKPTLEDVFVKITDIDLEEMQNNQEEGDV
ncbi:MAG: ABC transporter ATP-binding protein [Halanaerobium sp.]